MKKEVGMIREVYPHSSFFLLKFYPWHTLIEHNLEQTC